MTIFQQTLSPRDLARLPPPATFSVRAERPEHIRQGIEQIVWCWAGRVSKYPRTSLAPYRRFVGLVRARDDEVRHLSDARLKERAHALRIPLRQYGFRESIVAEAFALIREAAWRSLGMRHFDSQIMGGRVMLAGKIAEMQTGEGKTLTATLTAGTAALAGIPVHVLSVNDYLTQRDAAEMSPVYNKLGLSVGCIIHDVPHQERQAEYAKDITYCTNNELTFDYLRDRMVLKERWSNIDLQSEGLYREETASRRLLLRGLHFAILDEADSLLIDEARTPLIISGTGGGQEEVIFLRQAYDLSLPLRQGEHFDIDFKHRIVRINEAGEALIRESTAELGPLWKGSIRRREVVTQALCARYLFIRDEHYVVKDDKVQIVDENTGRVMADRSWERGLHQLIEIKEGCEVTPQRETLAKISYQRFFRRYLHLSGMTGTATEVSGELWDVYGLSVVKVPTHKPLQRKQLPRQVFRTTEQKWQAVVEEIQRAHQRGQPLLVATKTVGASEQLAQYLEDAGLPYQLLNAKQDKEEANIIAAAGNAGRVTVVTNIAGRGTDIKLSREAGEQGGLYVILTDLFEAGRIDRQVIGRCARQGDPGVYRYILSIDSRSEESLLIKLLGRLGRYLLNIDLPAGPWFAQRVLRQSQIRIEKFHFQMRKNMLRQFEVGDGKLSFVGKYE